MPSEYIDSQPKWNAYPYVRVDGVDTLVGPRSEDQFKLNIWEAEAFAHAVLAAVAWLRAR
jgi:hypothetical protein